MILYPEYKGSPNTWETPRLPAVEDKFIRELSALGTAAGYPRFRIVDGSNATFYYEGDPELPAGSYLRYAALVNVQRQDGWIYRADGETKKIDRPDRAPSGVMVYPNYETRDFGIPRYMIEVYRALGEPGVEEPGYVWAWTVDVKEATEMAGERAEISRYRHPSQIDLDHARRFLDILEAATKESIKRYAQQKSEARENAFAEQKTLRQEAAAESVERIVREII